ncbi:transcription initiation factor IIB [Podila humilis]|nr:transcription initiation factor IIB [Podila humilis]
MYTSESNVDLNANLVCPGCKVQPANLIEHHQRGVIICADCELVLGDRVIDMRSEWRTFADAEHDLLRVGGPHDPPLPGPQLDTVISRSGGSGSDTSSLAKELGRTHSRVTSLKGEQLRHTAIQDIAAMCANFQMPNVVGTAANAGRHSNMCAACLPSKQHAWQLIEISNLTQVPKRNLAACFKVLKREFLDTNTDAPAMRAMDTVPRFCSALNLSMEVEKRSLELATKVKDLGTLADKSPLSIVGACLYMAANMLG